LQFETGLDFQIYPNGLVANDIDEATLSLYFCEVTKALKHFHFVFLNFSKEKICQLYLSYILIKSKVLSY